MKVEEIGELLNSTASQFAGFESVVNNDLSNFADFGRSIEDAMGYDVFFGKLADQFNTIKFWARPHVSFAPNVLMEGEKFGAIRAMYRTGYMKMTSDPAWHLENGMSYDPYVVNKQDVQARFWSDKFDAMVDPPTIVKDQLMSAFRGPSELAEFIGMLEMARDNTYRQAFDNVIMSLYQAIIGVTKDGTQQRIKLLTEYNDISGESLTAAKALYSEGFIRYAIYRIGIIRDQMRLSTGMFNGGHYQAPTPPERQRTVMVTDFARAAGVYLHDAPNQFNTGNLQIPSADIVPAWQGMGTSGALADRMSINSTVVIDGQTVTTNVSNVLAVVHDEWALGVTSYRHKITTQYNPLGEYTNYFDKMYGGLFLGPDENVVVFMLA